MRYLRYTKYYPKTKDKIPATIRFDKVFTQDSKAGKKVIRHIKNSSKVTLREDRDGQRWYAIHIEEVE